MNETIIKLKDIIGLGTDEIERLREDAETDVDHITEVRVSIAKRIAKFVKEGK